MEQTFLDDFQCKDCKQYFSNNIDAYKNIRCPYCNSYNWRELFFSNDEELVEEEINV